ncbi:MAG TPA: hypothetical protein VHK69_09300 [Chitinophagaceae bacterium]|nr:hypothetical protein [Chitinophagaceae bacterium]
MNRKLSIRKILVVTAWLLVGSGMLTLLIAANRRKEDHRCKELLITVRGTGEHLFIEKQDVREWLERLEGRSVVGMRMTGLNPAGLEQSLEANPWVADAELYFDSHDALHVLVTERQPVARVFTTAGTSFYMDTAGVRMPLLERVTVRVPVVTNFPGLRRNNKKDSLLLQDVKNIARFVGSHPFWSAQVAQIDVVDRQFELIPTVGDHIIRVGNSENIEQKLSRLFVFYRQVAGKAGFHKYSALDVRFDGQVVAVHKGAGTTVDSVQLRKNIEELLARNRLMQEAAEIEKAERAMEAARPVADTQRKALPVTPAAVAASPKQETIQKNTETTRASTRAASHTNRKTDVPSKPVKTKPKAVMPRKVNG